MKIDEFEFQDKNGNEIDPTKTHLVIYIKSLHKLIKELKETLFYEQQSHDLCIKDFEEETNKLRKQIKFESDARKRFLKEVKRLKRELESEVNEKEFWHSAYKEKDLVCDSLFHEIDQLRM